ncbi:MAG: minichromosome maintenance protein MCM [archaeon]|nr:minichromosome maintenance protein MCM [archaeon]MDD2477757.1 minichromosome maintenance protein MCM [Candidatus ainarchaeum sp.]MDD3084620.1 minichromosome maintenance protein MCM [Candidatus ainarchaeum sp.]MDD4221334.1 minichromosome maintenance protein MCM [Candidatus ainarchaeum sp.]MDD4662843.1 minichromosome maintenance protein MCM [Candidatus ainarchaeum sp.]
MAEIDLDKELQDIDFVDSKNLAIEEYIDILFEFFEEVYKKEIEVLASIYPQERSFDIDYKKLEDFDLNVSEKLLENPHLITEAANAAINKMDIGILDSEVESNFAPIVRFFNLPEEYRVAIRDVGAIHIAKLTSLEGTIRLITERLEKLTVAHFVCRKCGTGVNLSQKTQQLVKPIMCGECKGREFDIDLDQSKFIDYQKIQMQEPLESLKGSDQAANIDVYLSEDLVNRVSAGDKIVVTGVLKLRPPKGDTNIFGKYIVANHILKVDQEYEELKISIDEEKEIIELSKKADIYDLLSKSIAPNIFGHDVVKEAITLQMFGGVKKEIAKQKLRGNIHVLLVGDPSTGKSKLLEYANILAPKSVYVAGKTVSGAGLTVSAVKDEFGEGGWTLKAGAVILASGGMAMIDEFDKINPDDRSSLHEAMAQSTVSVSKAGLYSKFKADTSILAAANPKYNRFDPYKNPIEQIDLPFSLISRFDLYFVIPDVLDRTMDLNIAKHVLKTQELAQKMSHSEKSNSISKEDLEEIEKKILPAIEPNIYKKYVAFSRQNIKPVLTAKASEKILNYYVELRDLGRNSRSFSATPRQLEGLIRLSEASAKIKLKNIIEEEDAERAIRIFKTSLEQTALDKETGKIDIDILQTGQSQSERNLVKTILKFIKDLSANGEPVPTKELYDFAEENNITREKAQDAVIKLKKIGDIYEPRNGLLKATEPDSF